VLQPKKSFADTKRCRHHNCVVGIEKQHVAGTMVFLGITLLRFFAAHVHPRNAQFSAVNVWMRELCADSLILLLISFSLLAANFWYQEKPSMFDSAVLLAIFYSFYQRRRFGCCLFDASYLAIMPFFGIMTRICQFAYLCSV